MSRDRDFFEQAIDEAYERETGDKEASTSDVRRRVVVRGRRRRAGRALGSVALIAVIFLGVTSAVDAFRDETRPAPSPDVPAIGSEKIMDFGGPIAATDDALFIANGSYSNDAGDKESIARFDLRSEKVTDTDPTSMSTPSGVSLGASGLWMVGWSGDLPLEGDPNRASGQIQLVDPESGEVLLDIPREGSAPYDVAAGEVDGRPVAWVVDAARHELLQVDGESGGVEAIEIAPRPNSVIVDGHLVWVTGNQGGEATLTRYDTTSGNGETVTVGHCLNDLVVHEGSVWVLDFCGKAIHRFDSISVEKQASVSLGEHPTALTAADGLVWVHRESDIVRVDPATNEIVGDPIVAGPGPSFEDYMVAAGDSVFVSSTAGVYRLAEGLPIREPHPEPTPEPEQTQDAMASETCSLEHVTCIPLDRESSVVGAGFGSAWVGNIGEGKTFGIARFDAETGEESSRLQTDGFVEAFAPDDRWMWALMEASGQQLQVLQIDPDTTQVTNTYDLGDTGNIGNSSVAVGDGYVWVSQPNGSVARISTDDGDITTASYGPDLPGYRVSNGPLYLAYGDGRLWLSYGSGHLGVVDPATGELLRVDEDVLGVNAYQIVFGGDTLWSPHQGVRGDNVLSYASTSGSDEDRGLVALLEDAPPGLAATDGVSVWVVQDSFEENQNGWLVRVDVATRKRVGEPLEILTSFQGGVAAGDGYVWVTGDRVLYRVETAE